MAKHRGRYSPNPSGAGVWCARAYTESLAAAAGAGRRGIDTQPLNIQLLGLLGVAVSDPQHSLRGPGGRSGPGDSWALDFLGLGWDAACRPNREDDVAFQGLTPGVSLTVRTRVEPGQVDCWRHYAEWLPAAFEADEADAG